MEEPKEKLEVFSSILLQEYIRLLTAVKCFQSEKTCAGAKFKISPENYERLKQEPLQAGLLGLSIKYDEKEGVLTAVPDQQFLHQYENKVLREACLTYSHNYRHRYDLFITYMED